MSWLSAHGNVSCYVIHWLAARHCSDHSGNRFWELNQLWETWEGWGSCLRGHRCTLLSEARVRELPAISVALLPNCEISIVYATRMMSWNRMAGEHLVQDQTRTARHVTRACETGLSSA